MTNESFDLLAVRLARLNARRPVVYRAGVVLLGLAGYAYIIVSVAVLAAAAIMIGRIPTGLSAGAQALFAVLSVLFCLLPVLPLLLQRRDPARGVPLPRTTAPALHAAIESLRSKLGVPRIDGVLLGNDLGVEVVLMPRFGSLLGFRRYVVLGLPLITALPAAQLRAVIAHEIGHLSRRRGFLSSRVFRTRIMWLQLAGGLSSRRRWATALFRPFFEWYAPRFAACSLALATECEYEADRRAAAAAGCDNLAAGLLRLGVVHAFMSERFYPRMLRDIRHYGVPPSGMHLRLEKELRRIRTDPRCDAWVDAALRGRRTPHDSHPSLRDRITALRVAVPNTGSGSPLLDLAFPAAPVHGSTARHYLGDAAEHLTISVEMSWVADARQAWAERHEELRRMDDRRKELDGRPGLGFGESLEYIISTAETEGSRAALPLARELIEQRSGAPPAHFVLGRLLLDLNDPEGVEHLETAMAGDAELVEPGCDLIIDFLRASGRPDETPRYLQRKNGATGRPRVEAPAEPVGQADGDRSSEAAATGAGSNGRANGSHGPEPHGLDPQSLLLVRRKIAPMAAIARAYLVRGNTGDAGSADEYTLGIELMRGRNDASGVASRVEKEVEFPGPTSVVVLTRRHRGLRNTLERVEGAMIFQRTRRRTA